MNRHYKCSINVKEIQTFWFKLCAQDDSMIGLIAYSPRQKPEISKCAATITACMHGLQRATMLPPMPRS
jgi:hypothetical protein